MKTAVAIRTVNPRTETRAKNSKSGINSIRTREWRIIQRPEMKCRAPTVVNLSKGGFRFRWIRNAITASGVPAYARL